MTHKDVAIRVSGMLQAIMSNPNIPPEQWEARLRQAYLLHDSICKLITGGSNGKTQERRE